MFKVKNFTGANIDNLKLNLYCIEPYELDVIRQAIQEVYEIHSDTVVDYIDNNNIWGLKLIVVSGLLNEDFKKM